VVRELVTKFTEQNVTVQRNQATLTTSFLADELKTAKENLDRLDAAILKFKSVNQGRLPEQLPANIQSLQGLRMELNQINEAINRDNQEKMFEESTLQSLKNQTAFINSNLEDTVGARPWPSRTSAHPVEPGDPGREFEPGGAQTDVHGRLPGYQDSAGPAVIPREGA